MPPRREPQVGLGRAIRQLRDAVGLSQEELAHIAGLSQTWVSHLESGRNPQWSTVARLAAALNTPLAELAELAERLDRR